MILLKFFQSFPFENFPGILTKIPGTPLNFQECIPECVQNLFFSRNYFSASFHHSFRHFSRKSCRCCSKNYSWALTKNLPVFFHWLLPEFFHRFSRHSLWHASRIFSMNFSYPSNFCQAYFFSKLFEHSLRFFSGDFFHNYFKDSSPFSGEFPRFFF